jgi:hypothetical protein
LTFQKETNCTVAAARRQCFENMSAVHAKESGVAPRPRHVFVGGLCTEIEFLPFATVGAVYDRMYFVDSRKGAQS